MCADALLEEGSMGSNKYKILVLAHEATVCSRHKLLLESSGYQVITAEPGTQGVEMCDSHCPDLIILDLGSAEAKGLQRIKSVRSHSNAPLLVLSDWREERYLIAALDRGANDYMPATVGTGEFLARIRATFRTRSQYAGVTCVEAQQGDLRIDYGARRVFLEDREIRLTQTEYNILSLLMLRPGRLVSYTTIMKEIWGVWDDGSIKKLQVNVSNIRKKLGVRPGDDRYIFNEPGIGYRINKQEE